MPVLYPHAKTPIRKVMRDIGDGNASCVDLRKAVERIEEDLKQQGMQITALINLNDYKALMENLQNPALSGDPLCMPIERRVRRVIWLCQMRK